MTITSDEIPVIADETVTPASSAGEISSETLLYQALDRLRPDDKELLVLTKLEGLKYREVGVLLNVPENTIKIKVFRALRSLKNEYVLLDQYYHQS